MSTVVAVVISVLVLAVLVAFVALGSGDDSESAGEDGLPSGFSEIPEDVFFNRIFGAQRTAGSWHFEQSRTIGGVQVISVSSDTELGEGAPDHDAEVVRAQKDGTQATVGVKVLDGVYYAKGLPTVKPWWRLERDGTALSEGVIKELDALISQDTSEELQTAVQSISLVGPDAVEGVETARYRVILGENPVPAPEGGATEEPMLAELDVWVDAEQRPVRMVVTVGEGPQTLVTTTTYTRYGEDLDIASPPASEVTTEAPKTQTPPAPPKAQPQG